MSFNLEIPLIWMEELEKKYHINLHVDMYEDTNAMYFYIDLGYKKEYLGCTYEQVEWELMDRYGY